MPTPTPMPTPTLRSQPQPQPRPTTTFSTREIEIPDSPEGSPREGSGSHFGGPPLAALPSALMHALAREPPAARTSPTTAASISTSSARTSSAFSRAGAGTSSPSPQLAGSPALPAIAPHSPLHMGYSSHSPSPAPSPTQNNSRAAATRRAPRHKASLGPDDADRPTAPTAARPSSASSSAHRVHSDSEGAGADTALGDGYVGHYASPSLPSEAERSGSGTKRSLWKNVAFGRSRAEPEPPLPSWSPPPAIYSRNAPPHLGGAGGLSPSPQLSATSPRSGATKWLMDASAPPPIGLGLDDDLEPVAPRRRSGKAPQGSDADDDEDDDPSPWSAGRGQQYTHDLTKGLRSTYDSDVDVEQERGGESDLDGVPDDDDQDADEELLSTVVAGSIPQPPDHHHSRRKPGAPLRIATDARHDETGGGIQTAPMVGSARPIEGPADSLRNRSWSDGDVALAGRESDHDLLAKGMGLPGPPPAGSSPRLQTTGGQGTRARKAEFTMAIVGPRNVGKSTVIRRGVKNPSRPTILMEDEHGNRVTTSSSNFMISGTPRTLEVLEIDSALLEFNAEGVIWPQELPSCEGIMVCFDATDPEAVPALLALLQGFWTRGSGIPTIVLACKASPTGEHATDLAETAAKCNAFGPGIVSLDGGVEDKGQKMRQCVNYMIRNIMDTRGEVRMATSPVSGGGTADFAAGSHPEMTTVTSNPAPLPDKSFAAAGPTPLRPSGSLGLEVVQESPVGIAVADPVVTPLAPEAETQQPFPTKAGPSAAETLESLEKVNRSKSSALDLHFSREDMIDKFLFASVTGNDEAYVTLFLIVYRRFVRPYDVVSKLIQRFEFVAGRIKSDPLLSRFAQMKLCGTLSMWFSYYPGDFSAPSTAGLLRAFLEDLLPRGATWVAHHAVELLPQLNHVSQLQDPEGSWALPDKPLVDTPVPQPDQLQYRRPSLAPSYDSAASSSHHVDSSLDGDQSRLSVPGSLGQHDSATALTSASFSASSDGRRRSGSDAATSDSNDKFSSSNPSSSAINRRGKGVVDSTLLDLSNALLELPEEVVAQQITRIAWGAFSHMTPRDLMRHVLAPRDPKNPRALLRDDNSNVMQSINLVNYLADWVATMVLIQSKLKWRARILEKFIHIAYQLRLLENFDSLMGVLAGLNSQPVFRLAETMETVNLKLEGDRTKIPKRLRSLNKLMATTKSFAAYRLALANSGTEMLPYLGVHLQDITVVNEVKSDMRDGKVNWSKFSQMGRSAAIVLDCSRQPPVYSVDRGVERCILNVPLLDKDRQYDLSYAYSPRLSTHEGSSNTRERLRRLKGAITGA